MSTFYNSPNDYRSYLAHHGVKGMKWGVRHEEVRKAKKMKKYGITSKEYDKAKKDAKEIMRPIKKIQTAAGGILGTRVASDALHAEANRMGLQHLTRWRRSLPQGSIPIDEYTRGALNAVRSGKSSVYNSSAIAIVPIGAVAGSAIGYAGGRILESVVEASLMKEAGQRKDRRYDT